MPQNTTNQPTKQTNKRKQKVVEILLEPEKYSQFYMFS